jgi:hypothetical protein
MSTLRWVSGVVVDNQMPREELVRAIGDFACMPHLSPFGIARGWSIQIAVVLEPQWLDDRCQAVFPE